MINKTAVIVRIEIMKKHHNRKEILMKLIFITMLIAAMMPTALSNGDYLSPNIGQQYPPDWLEGGYVRSSDRSMMMDPALAGMVHWLDAPVPGQIFTWYSPDVSFYKKMAPASTFSPFTEYYPTAGAPIQGEIISNPERLDIVQATPSYVFYGSGQGLPYSQHLSIVPPNTAELWIRGTENWTQYLVSPMGMTLDLVANVPAGGAAGFYETLQTETTSVKSQTYQFYEGYNTMRFNADEIGRHILYFVVNNQPSNVIMVDVFSQAPQTQSYIMPTTAPSSGDTPVTIVYPEQGSFQVYVDGDYIGAGSGGSFSFKVKGGMNHVISIWDGFWMYQKNIYFESGLPKEIYIEAV